MVLDPLELRLNLLRSLSEFLRVAGERLLLRLVPMLVES